MAQEKRKFKKKTVKAGKDLDVSTVGAFKAKLTKSVKQGIVDLVLDMKGVERIDSMGLGLVIAAQHSMAAAGGKLSLKNVPENLFQLFRIMHLDMIFEIQGFGKESL